jgi:hypothetical protein
VKIVRADDTHHIFVLGLELAEHPRERVLLRVVAVHDAPGTSLGRCSQAMVGRSGTSVRSDRDQLRLWTGQELVWELHASSRIGRTSSTVLQPRVEAEASW